MLNQPLKHHFLPIFYLKQWVGEKGRLVQFSKPYQNQVVPKRKHPDGTGYINRLYAISGVPDDEAVRFERAFLSPVDSKAAEALVIMRDEHAATNFTAKQRRAWVEFLTSLMARMPADIAMIKEHVKGDWLAGVPELQERYFELKADGNPDQVLDFIRASGDSFFERGAMEILERIIRQETVAQAIASMHWSVLMVDRSDFKLLTSDRPIIYTPHMMGDDSHVLVLISPTEIFLAARKRDFSRRIRARTQTDFARLLNGAVVGNATKYVYGRDDSQLRFIQHHMGTKPVHSLVERLHRMRLQRMEDIRKRQIRRAGNG